MEQRSRDRLTLEQVGIKLLADETPEVGVELEGGITEEFDKRQATLLLTDRRLIRYSVGVDKISVISASVEDVHSVEISRTGRNRQWVWVGSLFVTGGLLLSILSFYLLSSPISPLLMAISLILIGIVFMLTYVGGMTGQVVIRAGVRDIRCKMKPSALDDMTKFVERFHELKSGIAGNAVEDDRLRRSPVAAARPD